MTTPSAPKPRHRIWRFLKRNLQLLIILGVLLIAVRLSLPFLVKWYVNKTLDEMPDYDGQIGDVHLALWRGAYAIKSVNIVKTDGDVPVPFFSSGRVEFSVEWKALFDGSLVAEIDFRDPVINFVNGPSEETSQVGVDKPWLDVIKKLFPLDINRFEVHNGSVHYRDFHSSPKIDLELDRIHMLATNLTNSKKLSKTLVANIAVTGRAFEEGDFEVSTRLDPSTDKPTFDLNMKMTPVSLTKLNEFSHAYAAFDFEKGTMAVAAELACEDGDLKGYVKPVLDGIAIIDVKDVKNPVKLVWESLVAGVTRLFRNQPNNRLATKIPISGTFSDPKIGVFPTLGNILKNEFIRVFKGDVENIIDLSDAEGAKPAAREKKPEPDKAEKPKKPPVIPPPR